MRENRFKFNSTKIFTHIQTLQNNKQSIKLEHKLTESEPIDTHPHTIIRLVRIRRSFCFFGFVRQFNGNEPQQIELMDRKRPFKSTDRNELSFQYKKIVFNLSNSRHFIIFIALSLSVFILSVYLMVEHQRRNHMNDHRMKSESGTSIRKHSDPTEMGYHFQDYGPKKICA